MSKNLSAHDVFWLARHAHNTLAPLVKAAQQYEPTTSYESTLSFAHEASLYHTQHHIDIWVRAGNRINNMLTHATNITTTAQIDAVAAKVQTFIDTEQAALEAAHDAAAEELTLADLAADQDWGLRLERAAERADMERDEDAHDIEQQNEMAGN